jgi:hypothetical protein
MKKNTKNEINRYTSANSCLFVIVGGKLKRIKTPFKVRCMQGDHKLQEGKIYTVSLVKCDYMYRLKYIISGKSYPYSDFELII